MTPAAPPTSAAPAQAPLADARRPPGASAGWAASGGT
jgi:hypothetical protein